MGRGPLPPLVHKIMCGQRLEALRERALLSQLEVAKRFEWSQSKVANIETAVSAVSRRDLELLLELYEVAERDELFEMAAAARKQLPRWKGVLRNRFEGTMRQVVDMEFSAETTWRHNSMVVPGLLQTEDCMRYLFRAYRPSWPADEVESGVERRLGRQAALDNTDQRFWFVIHEAALRSLENVGGGDSVLREQARVLMAAIDRPNVEVRVSPFRNGYYPGQEETYTIFGFDTVHVTYVEKYDGGDILHDEKNLTRFTTFWEQQRVHALGPEQTRPFLWELSRP
ncbi:helix-turn-helix domain-containing protein [Actinophytocola algeriensis]|uniref:Transcriptional regulator with XRE-family HTH domain n=1 Tax=Actinophytocola algeriensis TaxID=1768010 RepID=A0A7W7Q040_9PSEU|nr:helix-turn-helix transcriptional regulator [Actinophytocola algeriensis]MBB4904403.1 transcriptional regulator with XRE-family HTH domain [Actinophytocola algeriensis]MBE1476739.1 transcriptional regulator with XRE-family HTH domain [Actinophytocola algeriensis]